MNSITSTGSSSPRVLVLGGGISGLSAAWYMKKFVPTADVHLWEKNEHVGGVLKTIARDGWQFEQSADNFITTEPWAVDLCKEVGLGDEIVPTTNKFRRTFVVRRGKLYPLPDGFLMMAPTKLFPLAFTPLLGPFGKIRAGLELFLPRHEKTDESLAQFVIRRLGRQVYDRIVEPLVSGIYAGDAKRLSVWATLPRFPEMETKYRSLILAMKRQQKQAKKIKRDEESGARYSFFVAMRNGLSHFAETIADRLPPNTVQLGREAAFVEQIVADAGGSPRWQVTDTAGNRESFDAVISALPAPVVAKVFAATVPGIANVCSKIELSSAAVISVGYQTSQIRRPMNGMGFVVPELEKSLLIAGSFSSHKYPHRAPEGTTLLRLFAGGTRAPEVVDLPEDELIKRVTGELTSLLDIDGPPQIVEVSRWPQSMPQYNVGHLDLLDRLESELASVPTLALAGNAFRGVGLPACIKSGRQAAERIGEGFK